MAPNQEPRPPIKSGPSGFSVLGPPQPHDRTGQQKREEAVQGRGVVVVALLWAVGVGRALRPSGSRAQEHRARKAMEEPGTSGQGREQESEADLMKQDRYGGGSRAGQRPQESAGGALFRGFRPTEILSFSTVLQVVVRRRAARREPGSRIVYSLNRLFMALGVWTRRLSGADPGDERARADATLLEGLRCHPDTSQNEPGPFLSAQEYLSVLSSRFQSLQPVVP